MPQISLRKQFQPAAEILRTYWLVITLIQITALCAVLAYYKLDGAAGFYARLAHLKEQGGLLFVAVSTIISGGIIPEILKRFFRPKDIAPPGIGELLNQFVMWAGLGILIDRFYALQGMIYGDSATVVTLVLKVVVDQLVYAPLVTFPFVVSCFLLHESNYKIGKWIQAFSLQTWFEKVLPLWMTCLSFWPVMLLIIYSLPVNLQFPLFLFGNSAYSILMIGVARKKGMTGDAQPG